MNIYKLAVKYYPNLWNKQRLVTLVNAGKLTQEQMNRIVENYSKKTGFRNGG